MFQTRYVFLAFLGFLTGCIVPAQVAEWIAESPGDSGQSVADVAPSSISDPNDPALDSPATGQAPISVRLSNPTERDADCRVTMELIGREVHFSLRRILAATQSLIVGPDQADIVRIEVTFSGEPAAAMEPQVLRIGQDFAPGDIIEFVLALPPVEEDGGEEQPPPPVPEVGACCLTDGTCEVLTAEQCAASDGQYQGDDTSCDPNPCLPPVGACCLPDGTCELLTAEECSASDGQYQGDDTSCDPNPCPPPVGACCLEDGICAVLTVDECLTAGGEYQGDFTSCVPNPCVPPAPECPAGSLYAQPAHALDGDWLLIESERYVQGLYTLAFDNFSDIAGQIDGVHWWGVALSVDPNDPNSLPFECVEADPTFDITFYEDLDGTPGYPVCSYTAVADVVPTGTYYDGLELLYYSVDGLDPPCALGDGWISIQGRGDPTCWFHWMTSAVGDSLCWLDLSGKLIAAEYDLGVCLTGTETPPAPGDMCDNPIVVNVPADLPYCDLNTTCGRWNYYADTCLSPYDAGEDIIYELFVTEPISVEIMLDPMGMADTGVALSWDCPPLECIAISTETSGKPYGMGCQLLQPGTYYIMVDTLSPDCLPDFTLTIHQCEVPMGACCVEGETCLWLTESECLDMYGEYQGDGTTCVPNPCVEPSPFQ